MRTCHSNAVGYQARGNGYTGLIFFVGSPICIIGDHSGDTRGRGSFERINNDEKLHDGTINRAAKWLNNKGVSPTDVIIYFYKNIFIAKLKNISIAEGNA